MKGRHDVFKIDNMAGRTVWMVQRLCKNDESASEVLKGVHYLSGLLGTTVHVDHVDRISTDMAQLADELSRKEFSCNAKAGQALNRAEFRPVEGCLVNWLRDPCGKMDLCSELQYSKR